MPKEINVSFDLYDKKNRDGTFGIFVENLTVNNKKVCCFDHQPLAFYKTKEALKQDWDNKIKYFSQLVGEGLSNFMEAPFDPGHDRLH